MNIPLPTAVRPVVLLAVIAVTVSLAALPPAPSSVAAEPAGTGSISLHVQSARTVNPGPGFVHKGDPVAGYHWMINVDDTGDPGSASNPGISRCLPATAPGGSQDPNFADTCQWPSIRNTSGLAPIVAQGDQTELSEQAPLGNLPAGKYLISVTAANFKIDGAHFTITPGATTPVTVEMNPTPLPLTTLRLQVFNDHAPVDGTYEADAENGLAGFTASVTDVLGLVSTDYYGNALCTKYQHSAAGRMLFDANNRPIVAPDSTGRCVSDSTGLIVIPNLGPNRYAATVSPPPAAPGQTYQWVQTTTLEGGHDYDIWQQEGETGLDTEQLKGGEPVPAVQFGFVRTQAVTVPTDAPAPTGEIRGVAIAGLPYIGGQNGQVVPETGFAGAKSAGPIRRPWVALSDLDGGDAAVYVGRGGVDGSFDIKNLPDSTYQLTIWDDDQDYILWSFNVEVHDGALTDVGNKMIVGWFTHVYGTVFIDSNGNGRRDPGEAAVPQFPLTVRERDNSLMDQYTNTATTDATGAYDIREAYPLGRWLILEAFNTRYRTTGITYQGDNEATATTRLGSLVDVNFLPIIGLGGRIDWGVQPYAGSNGGIVGTVTYDTTRNELDPADAATEAYQPGIPDVPVHLYLPQSCTAAPADQPNECRQGHQIVPLQIKDPTYVPDPNDPAAPAERWIDNPDPHRGALTKGPEVQDAYTSETWQPPRGCTARQYNGQVLTDQQALPEFGTSANRICVAAPMMGVAVGPSDATPGNASQTVNGNYGFATSKINLYPPTDTAHNPDGLALYAPLPDGQEQDLPARDYIVEVQIPTDPVDGKPMYKVTGEEDVNVFSGDTYLPQENYPPITAAEANDPAGPPDKTPLPPSQPPSQQAGIISPCAGALHTVNVTNPDFNAAGGSPFQGYDRPSCVAKLVTLRSNQAVAPNFNLFTEVPIPTHFWGLTIDDLGLTLDKRSINYGEALGLPFVPMGLYDWAGRLVDTVHTDFNGYYEALEPSTGTYNCPVPAGPCPNMYRFVGNDPGQPGALNPDYNPAYRTIATNFQGWPGLFTVTDTAPTHVATTALSPGTTIANPTICDLGPATPQLLSVDRPYVRRNTAADTRAVTINGFGFGPAPGKLTLGSTVVTATSWSDTTITFTVPAAVPSGPTPIGITNTTTGLSTVNGLTLQVLDAATASAPGSTATNPRLAEVGPGKPYPTIQAAIEAARPTSANRYWLVVVWPNTQSSSNPRGEYTENLIVHHQIGIQGVGPGGFTPTGSFVRGSIIDGAGFNADNPSGQNWIALLSSLRYSGDPEVPDAAVITVLDDPAAGTLLPASYPLRIDGFTITGGAQSNLPVNINAITGGVTTPYGATGALVTQGGGIYVHRNVRGMQITDNIIRGNGGSYGGALRLGTPYTGDNRNYNLRLARNQIRDNGGTNLAGGIGLFGGSDGYQVTDNAICGNFSAEYGGAITAFGYQVHPLANLLYGATPGGRIAKNRIWFNSSYDEGGAVMIAGELPADPSQLSEGTGPAAIDANVIQTNLASDDGGGIRLLQTSGSHISRLTPEMITITNNTIANNVSAHEGGGIALDDAAFVTIVNNTVTKNLTTATAITSDGQPAPAGLSSAANSDPLQARLQNTSLFPRSEILATTTFSKPALLNNVFWDNRAGTFSGGWVTGIGGTLPDGSTNDIFTWDMGIADLPDQMLTPSHSLIGDPTGWADDGTNVTSDPRFKQSYDVTVNVLASRTYPAFRQSVIVAQLLPPSLMGDYHLATGTPASPARGLGAAAMTVRWGAGLLGFAYQATAPSLDIDGQPRPTVVGPQRRYDAGSDQMSP